MATSAPDISGQWKALNPKQRESALSRMSPEQKQKLASSLGFKGGSAPVSTPPPQPTSGVGRFLSSAAAPITGAATGLYHAATDAPKGPVEQSMGSTPLLFAKRALLDPQIQQGQEAMDSSKSVPERVGHGMAALLPVFGPWAAQVAETGGKQLGAGDYAGAAGTAVGNAALYAAPKAVGKLRSLGPEARVNKLAYAAGEGTADLAKKTLPDVQKAAEATGKRKTVGDYLTNVKKAKGDLNTEYANALGPYAGKEVMPSEISQRIRALKTTNMDKTAAGKAEARAIENAALEFDKGWTLAELDAERMTANARLSAYEDKSIADQYSTLRKSRTVAIDKAIADGVRETVYPQMDQLAGKPPGYFASLKQQIGNLLELESKTAKQAADLHDKTARIKGAPRLSKAKVAEGAVPGGKHGVIRSLVRAAVPENPEKTANKRVAKALRPNGKSTALATAAVAGEQEDDE